MSDIIRAAICVGVAYALFGSVVMIAWRIVRRCERREP